MRTATFGIASALATVLLAFASPIAAADLMVPRYSEVPDYEYRAAAPFVVEGPAAVIVARPRVVIEEYPIYAAPPVYVAPPYAYAYAGPVRREGWAHRGHYRRW